MNSDTLSLKNITNELGLLKKDVIVQRNAWKKDLLLLANNLNEKLLDSCNAKEHCESFIRKKTTKSVKQSELITYQ